MRETKGDLAQIAAAALREDIVQGVLPPGTHLREQLLSERMNVSRNTLREAFRILEVQGLIDHRAHYGASVRALSEADLTEIYAIRSTLEVEGVRRSGTAPRERIAALVEAVDLLQDAALRGEWHEVGTLSLAVHRRIVQLIGSARFDDLFSTVAAQARLAFSLAPDPESFQAPWVARDVEIVRMIVDARLIEAERALRIYLIDSETKIIAVTRSASLPRPQNRFPADIARDPSI